MQSAPASRSNRPLKISGVGPTFGSAKLTVALAGGALTLGMLLSLLLIAARPAQAQTETVLHNFTNGGDGANPLSSLIFDGDGNLYGTTFEGGLGVGEGYGTVFELSRNGNGSWSKTVVYNFCSVLNCTDGEHPAYTRLIFDSAENLYGTTRTGGANGLGVVFELSSATGSWTETVLHSFVGGTDGSDPINGLIMDSSGNLYGVTNAGGSSGWGVVYELSPSGGGWTEQIIYNLPAQVDFMYAGLTMDAAGNIFGATYRPGTVFELSPNGNGGWNPITIHSFAGSPKDGDRPKGTPVFDKAGKLYGTTEIGGAKNLGTVYRLTPGKKGKWTEKILHSFSGGPKDGASSVADIAFDAVGNLYGTTFGGGKSGDGTVFELVAPVSGGSYKEKIVWNFNYTDGAYPYGGLILDSAGNLYGTTSLGGSNGAGTVFEATP